MQEYVSEAVVLDKMPQGDLDNRFFLFTKRFGKLVAKAKSGRKITSKLSPHLEPGNVSFVRLIEKNGLQVGDALKTARIGAEPPQLAALNALLSEFDPDERLWRAITAGTWNWAHILKILGWDPAGASCWNMLRSEADDRAKSEEVLKPAGRMYEIPSAAGRMCDGAPRAFHLTSQNFFCGSCSSKLDRKEVILI
ncbi:MAG: hypothetical protein A2945_00865 [Candidatus Liptonbacteria bacterium RIFCSPLOWO2_01_FULL_52_25]|uniref:DNA replication/recombination mediator RecO N-terminal domain-containing protein n=1 Tax=Candidatus Liptonbacteria bacterium RIFCSPLOWO2_01_FULL_52_25 TaxID=1798650 RepID=A0A1G2CDB7_9BACT|nr:MAG: hypothetical protein A2945_00865 [Candidatus Liptonbacteria bacterium RIFCSPLOWO2_01_FULL_52_25]